MTDALKRVEIGFDGGQVVALRISEKALGDLRKHLGSGWQRIETDDGVVDVDCSKVAFVRTEGDDHKVGF